MPTFLCKANKLNFNLFLHVLSVYQISNINYICVSKIYTNILGLLKPTEMPRPKAPAICKSSQQIIFKWRNSKQGQFSNYLISKESYGSFKSYICFLIDSNSFIAFSHSSQQGPFLSLVIYLLFKHNNMEMVIHSQLAKIRPSSVKIWRI